MSTSKKLKSEQLFVRVETVMHDLQISRPFAYRMIAGWNEELKEQGYINDLQKEKDYYWNKFLERKRQKESYVFEKEIENIMAWKSQLDTLLDTENL